MVDNNPDWLMLLSIQEGIIDREQARRLGLSDRQIGHRLSSGRWQRVHVGVYATFTGPLSRNARLWAAVRRAGDGAMLSHETAAEVQGIIDRPLGNTIHVTVPPARRPAQLRPARGITIHRSDQGHPQLSGPFQLPRTSVEDTVLDLAAAAPSFDRAYEWISRAVSRQLVSVSALRAPWPPGGRCGGGRGWTTRWPMPAKGLTRRWSGVTCWTSSWRTDCRGHSIKPGADWTGRRTTGTSGTPVTGLS